MTTPNVRLRAHLLPQLICLEALSPLEQEKLLDRIAQYRRHGIAFLSALLGSDAATDDMVQHFRFTLEQARPGSRQHWWLRCYDPRVFRHLCWLLDERRMERLMGPVTTWRWPDATGHWHHLDRLRAPDRSIHVALLADRQWAVIDRMALLNATIDRLAMLAPECVAGFEDYARLDRLLAEALERGLSDDEDRRLYAEQAARFHPRIHDHPEMRRRLDQTAETQGSYLRRCADLSARSLLAMARELETIT